MSDLPKPFNVHLKPIDDYQLIILKYIIETCWAEKPHYEFPDSPKCVMYCHELLAMIKRIEIAEGRINEKDK